MAIEIATRHAHETISGWYWRRAVATDDVFHEDRDNAGPFAVPPAVKLYPQLPLIALPPARTADLGSADAALARARGRPAEPAGRQFDPTQPECLSVFLYYAFGFSRHDIGPYETYPQHRTVPSARCRFPTQLYLLLPGSAAWPQGVYYFDAAHHALVPVAPAAGPTDLRLDAGVPNRPPVSASVPLAVFVLTSLFWNTASVYQHYAYRLCMQEIGLTLGSLEVVAAAHGLAARRHHDVDADALAALLGLPPDEESPAVVLSLHSDHAPVWKARRPTTASPRRPLPFEGSGDLDRDTCRAVIAIDRAARAARPRQDVPAPAPPDDGVRGFEDAPPWRLDDVIHRRHSGGDTFEPLPEPIDRAVLDRVLWRARARDAAAVPGVAVRMVVAANNVRGLAAGTYEWEVGGSWRTLGADPVADAIQRSLAPLPTIVARTAPALVWVVADHADAARVWADAATKVLSVEAGAITHRLLLAAAAEDLAGRVANAVSVTAFRTLTGIADIAVAPLFSVFLGRKRGSCVIEFPVSF